MMIAARLLDFVQAPANPIWSNIGVAAVVVPMLALMVTHLIVRQKQDAQQRAERKRQRAEHVRAPAQDDEQAPSTPKGGLAAIAASLVICKPNKPTVLSWKGALAVIVTTVVVALLFDHFGRLDLARPTLYGMVGLVFVVAMGWQLRVRVWFWLTLTLFVALHAIVIWLVPWSTSWVPAVAIIPIIVADVYVMYWILSVIGKFVEGPQISEELKRPEKV